MDSPEQTPTQPPITYWHILGFHSFRSGDDVKARAKRDGRGGDCGRHPQTCSSQVQNKCKYT